MVKYTVSDWESNDPCSSMIENRHIAVGLVAKSIEDGIKHAAVIDKDVMSIDTDRDFITGSSDDIVIDRDINLSIDGILAYSHHDTIDRPIRKNDIETVFSNDNNIHTVCSLAPREISNTGFIGIAVHCIRKTGDIDEGEYNTLIQSINDTREYRIPKLVEVFGEYCSHGFSANMDGTKYPLGLSEDFYR